MAYSAVAYTGDGNTTDFTIPFAFLSKNYLLVTIQDGIYAPYPAPFQPISDNLLRIFPAPAIGSIVRISRTTPVLTPVTDFKASPALTGDHLNTQTLQLIHALQELHDKCSVVADAANVDWLYPDVVQIGTQPYRPPEFMYPVQVMSVIAADRQVTLAWAPVGGAREYYVRWGTSPSALSVITPLTYGNSWNISGGADGTLVNGATYYFQVVASSNTGQSFSRIIAAVPVGSGTGPIPLPMFSAVAQPGGGIKVSWGSAPGLVDVIVRWGGTSEVSLGMHTYAPADGIQTAGILISGSTIGIGAGEIVYVRADASYGASGLTSSNTITTKILA